jgi:hypothetical protein
MNATTYEHVMTRIFEEFKWTCNKFRVERSNHPNSDDIVCARLCGRIAGLQNALEHMGMYNLAEYLPWDTTGINLNYTVPVYLKDESDTSKNLGFGIRNID